MRIPAFPMTRPAAFSAPLSKSIAKVVSSINEKCSQARSAQANHVSAVIAKASQLEAAAADLPEPAAVYVPQNPSHSSGVRVGSFKSEFESVSTSESKLRFINYEHAELIKKHLALAADETRSAEDRKTSGAVAAWIKERYMYQINSFQQERENSARYHSETKDTESYDIMKDYSSAFSGLSNLEDKSIDEIFDAVNSVADILHGYADRLNQANKEKYNTELEWRSTSVTDPQYFRDFTESQAKIIADGKDWSEVKILWEQSMRFQLDPDQVKHIFTRA